MLVLGSLQMVGYLIDVKPVRGLGACTAASPFPKVFSAVKGYETFSPRFTLIYESGGAEVLTPITPEFYQRLQGPYNRRNVYGAALSYGPRLPRPIWETIFCYGIAPGGPFRRELGIPEDAVRIRVLIEATAGEPERWVLEPTCGK